MSDHIISIIRTVVPALIGLLWAQLTPILEWASNVGINVDRAAVEALILSAVIGAWYTLARWLENRFPWFKWINGVAKQPTY